MSDKTHQNGKATQNGNGKEVTLTQPVVKVEPPKIETTTNPLEVQRARAQTLNDLFEKEKKLTDSRSTLKSFVSASDEDTNKLELRDGKGKLFSTGNPVVIAKVIALVHGELNDRINDVQLKIIAA